MIYTTVNLNIKKNVTTFNKKIVLYRGDRNVEIRFVLQNNNFVVLESTSAQLIIVRPNATPIFSTKENIQDDTVIFTITGNMIDEIAEIGEYTFQIVLYDQGNARVTLPPCEKGIEIREPIALSNEINSAVIGYSMLTSSPSGEAIYDEDGNYIKMNWKDGDVITDHAMNKMDTVIFDNRTDINMIKEEYVTDDELEAKGYLTEHQSLEDYAKKTELPTKVSELENDSNFISSIPSEYVTDDELEAKGYLTEHQDISGKADKTELPTKVSELENDSNFISSIPSEYVTETELNDKGYLTEHQDISGLATKEYVDDVITNLDIDYDSLLAFDTNEIILNTDTDMENIIGQVNEDGTITINDLPEGRYSLRYEFEDGSQTEICSFNMDKENEGNL